MREWCNLGGTSYLRSPSTTTFRADHGVRANDEPKVAAHSHGTPHSQGSQSCFQARGGKLVAELRGEPAE